MSVRFNHTIVWCRDKKRSATFLADVLGLPGPKPFGPFQVVHLDDGASLDFDEIEGDIASHHYAFLIDEGDFDPIFGRIRERGIPYWADPGKRRAGEIYHHNGGRGVYFADPDGHLLEILTQPYASSA
jgi:catechol 2,3-dioxygenase-like lactoylglutathione lyase family enzyme